MDAIDADEKMKLVSLRQSIVKASAAGELLQGVHAVTYAALKDRLTKEFGTKLSRQEVYDTLRARVWRPEDKETIHRYMLAMTKIARRADLSEIENRLHPGWPFSKTQ